MPKLNLKRTPQEEADRQQSKKRRRREKSPKASGSRSTDEPSRKWDSSDDSDADDVYGPAPPEAGPSSRPLHPESNAYKPDLDSIRAELEEARFREKMADAFADDDRLDSVEARMNEYSHVPDRWKTGRSRAAYDHATAADDIFKLDPQYMDEEEYAEWIRAGMYRKTHAQEYEQERQKKAARAAKRAQEKALKAETARLAQIAEAERKRKKLEKAIRRAEYARQEYHTRWKILLAAPSDQSDSLGFADIPWPVLAAYRERDALSVDDLTVDAIAAFIIPSSIEMDKNHRKEKLRETFLRFHPDKFEGRFMARVREKEQERVREGIGAIVRALNALMTEDK
ncbi:hypothetical protein FB45DRAFT_987357 [Roridomyces roridus]|uniref:Uncharacterized protein n=1 Tax=Roridomyces roridus TaxID=1738132 RepID=A0AAD7G0E0_9AGAR|nr:hypothetical protein FB45DRAFT_987357 [Roridomyces roridus]